MSKKPAERPAPKAPDLFTSDTVLTRPMVLEESERLVGIIFRDMAEKKTGQLEGAPLIEGTAAELEGDFTKDGKQMPFGLAVFVRRFAAFAPDMKLNALTVLWLVTLADNPAKVVMLAHCLWRETLKHGEAIDIHRLVEACPNGVPTEDAYIQAWDAQKIDPDGSLIDNWLDTPDAWAAP